MRGLLIAVVIVASVPSGTAFAVKDVLVQAAKVAGCEKPRVVMFSEFPEMRIEVTCAPEEKKAE